MTSNNEGDYKKELNRIMDNMGFRNNEEHVWWDNGPV